MTLKLEKRQRGLTLVELMVAMLVALILMAGAVQVFIANRVTLRTQDGVARVQESGRYAMSRIGRSARAAGFFGCAGLDIVLPNVLAQNPPADLSQFTAGVAVSGLDNVAAGNPFNAVAGTDVLTLRGAGDGNIGLTGNLTPINANIQISNGYDGFKQGELVLVTDCRTADLIRKTNQIGQDKANGKETIAHSNSSNIDNNLSKPYGADAFVMRPFIHSYFIGDTGRTNAAGQKVLALYLRDLSGNDSEIAEGVSDLQVLYGVDNDGNRNADRYMSATQVEAAKIWEKVVSVRVSLLTDSVDNVLENPGNYVFSPAGNSPITPAAGDRRLYQEFTGLYALRNKTL